MIAAARAVRVEICGFDGMLLQIFAGWAVLLNGAGRRDVVGGHAVAKYGQHTRILDVAYRAGLCGHLIEIRCAANVSRTLVPSVSVAFGDGKPAPVFVSGEDVVVTFAEHVGGNRAQRILDLALRWPEIGEVNRLTVSSGAQRLFPKININFPRQCKCHHQWRRHQIVCAHVRIDASFKISIAREHGGNHEVLAINLVGDFFRQRAGVSDASGAAVSDDVEFQFLEIGCEAGMLQIVANDFRPGRK